MQFTSLASICFLLAASVHAASTPSKPPPAITDVQILNYALTLEHLENAFYSQALNKFDDSAFSNAGLNRSLFSQISQHEAAHVQFLETALGDQATKACNYSFPYSDPKGFASLSMILEGVGVSAYLGAAASISNKQYLTAAGAILTTESRHSAWVSSVADGQAPWSGPLDTPLDFNQVFSLAAPFITACPSSNPALPVKAFPALNITTTSYMPGSNVTLAFNTTGTSGPLFVVFMNGLTPTFAPYDAAAKSVTLPANLTGTVYAVVSSSQNITDDSTVAGPAILMFGVAAQGSANGNGNGSGATSDSASKPVSSSGSGAGRVTAHAMTAIGGVLGLVLFSSLVL